MPDDPVRWLMYGPAHDAVWDTLNRASGDTPYRAVSRAIRQAVPGDACAAVSRTVAAAAGRTFDEVLR